MCSRPDPTLTMPGTMLGMPVAQLGDATRAISKLLAVPGANTSSLELKDQLRAEGFFCTQEMSSYFLERTFANLEHSGDADELTRGMSPGRYIVYELANPVDEDDDPSGAFKAVAAPVAAPSAELASALANAVISQNTGNQVVLADATGTDLATLNQNHWYCYGAGTPPAVMDARLTRDQARVRYGHLNGIDFTCARACRVQNAAGR